MDGLMREECRGPPDAVEAEVPYSLAVLDTGVLPEAKAPEPRRKNKAQVVAKRRSKAHRITEHRRKLENEKREVQARTSRKKQAEANRVAQSVIKKRSRLASHQIAQERNRREEQKKTQRKIAERRREFMRTKIQCPGPLSPASERRREAMQRQIRRETAERLARKEALAKSQSEEEAKERTSKLESYRQRKRDLSPMSPKNRRPLSRCSQKSESQDVQRNVFPTENEDCLPAPSRQEALSFAADFVAAVVSSSSPHTPVWRRKPIPVTTPYQYPYPSENTQDYSFTLPQIRSK